MPERETMNVSLTAEQKAFVKGLVETGRFASDSEVVREGLRLLDERERQRRLEELLLEGLDSGEAFEVTPETMRQLRRDMAEAAQAARRALGKSA